MSRVGTTPPRMYVHYVKDYHDIFERNDEASAYLLGFWYADGCIFKSWSRDRKTPQGSLHFSGADLEHMTLIAGLFGKVPRVLKSGNCYQLKVKSEHLFKYCHGLVGSTKKSNSYLRLPTISHDRFHHFVRGFFDGDGSIYIKTYRNRHGKPTSELGTSFTAGAQSAVFLEDLKAALRICIPVGNKKISIFKHGSKLIFGQYDSMLLCNWMYKDASLYMERKKKIWDESDKNKLSASRKYFSNKV